MSENLGPQYSTVDQGVQATLNKLLEQFVPGILATLGSRLATSGMSSLVGSSLDWQAGLHTNMTPEGVFRYQQRAAAAQMGRIVGNDFQRTVLESRFNDMARMLVSQDTFARRPENSHLAGKELETAYNNFITGEAQSWMRKPGVSMLYGTANSMFGFDQVYASAPYMAAAMSSIATQAFREGDTRQITVGRRMLNNLFTGEWGDDGNGNVGFDRTMMYDRYAWGGMSQGDVAGIAAQMIRGRNPVSMAMRGLRNAEAMRMGRLSGASTEAMDIIEAARNAGTVGSEQMNQLESLIRSMGGPAENQNRLMERLAELRKGGGKASDQAMTELSTALQELTVANNGNISNLQDVVKKTTESFRESVRKMTQAMAPLKDVFGDDTGSLIKTIESVAGKSIGRMSAESVARIANMLADNVGGGNYSLNELGSTALEMQNRLNKMDNLSPFQRRLGAVMANDVLQGNNGVKPEWMTDSQWKAFNSDAVAGTHISEGADLQAKAYSIWRHRREQNDSILRDALNKRRSTIAQINADDTLTQSQKQERIDAANAEYNKVAEERVGFKGYERMINNIARSRGITTQQAAMGVAGVSTAAELESGMAYEGYRDAIESGAVGRMATSQYGMQVARRAGRAAAMSPGYRMGTGARSPQEAYRLFATTIGLIRENAEVANMSNEDRRAYLLGLTGPDGEARFTEQQVDMLNKSFTYSKASKPLENALNWAMRQENRDNAQTVVESAGRRRQLFNEVGTNMFQTGGILEQVMKDGGSIDAIRERIGASTKIQMTGMERDTFTALIMASGSAAREKGGVSESSSRLYEAEDEQRNARIAELEAKKAAGTLIDPKEQLELGKLKRYQDKQSYDAKGAHAERVADLKAEQAEDEAKLKEAFGDTDGSLVKRYRELWNKKESGGKLTEEEQRDLNDYTNLDRINTGGVDLKRMEERDKAIRAHEEYLTSEDRVNYYGNKMARYAMSAEGLSNTGFQEALSSYKNNMVTYDRLKRRYDTEKKNALSAIDKQVQEGKLTKEEAEKQKQGIEAKYASQMKGLDPYNRAMTEQRNLMVANMELGEEGTKNFMGQDVYDKDGRKLEGKAADDERMRRLDTAIKEANDPDVDPKKRRTVAESLQFQTMDDKLNRGSEEARNLYQEYLKGADVNGDGKTGFREGWSKFMADYRKKNEGNETKLGALDEVNKAFDQIRAEAGASKPESMENVLINLSKVMEDVKAVMDQLRTELGGTRKD